MYQFHHYCHNFCTYYHNPLHWIVSVPFRHGERISFSYLVSQKYTGDKAVVKVLRNSEILEFNIKLATHKRLIPAHIKGKPPSYYIIAGFVFTAVSVPYLRSEVCINSFILFCLWLVPFSFKSFIYCLFFLFPFFFFLLIRVNIYLLLYTICG